MGFSYFSDRETGPKPRTAEEVSERAWGGVVAAINSRLNDFSFAYGFPEQCFDGHGLCGFDRRGFWNTLRSEIANVDFPLEYKQVPPTLDVLDLLEFCHRHVAKLEQQDYDEHCRHYHLGFDREKGQEEFREDINRILARNGIAFELTTEGKVIRVSPPVLRESLRSAEFDTGDADLDSLLETARRKFLDPDIAVRKESLEKLWDAWERLKTLEPGNKRESVKELLDRTAMEPNLRAALEADAKGLSDIGNNFMIRHYETDKTPVERSEVIDYFFHRMFALIRLILKATSRGG